VIWLLCLCSALPHKYEIICDTSKSVVVIEKIDFQDYAPLKLVAEALDLNYVFDNKSQRLTLTDDSHKVAIIADISVIQCDTLFHCVAFPPRVIMGDVYLPVDDIIPVLGVTFGKLVFVRKIEEVPVIKGISLSTRADSTVIAYEWDTPLEFDVQLLMGQAIVEIDGQYKKRDKLKPAGEVTSVKVLPFNTYTRLEMEMGNVNSYIERDNEVVFFNKITTRIGVIVLDPGHGGIDPGAVGKKGLYEKDITLNICGYLQKLFEDSMGIKALLTREEDVYFSLKGRTGFANNHSADLFVSIHCNAAPRNKKSCGFETYFLSEAKTTEARAAAALENASLKFDGIEPTDEVSKILYDLAQSSYLEESNILAEFIQTSAENNVSVPSRGISQAGFYVLRGAFMPAVLVETAFISNLEEEKLLKTTEFQKKLAYSIFKGTREFIADYERRMNN